MGSFLSSVLSVSKCPVFKVATVKWKQTFYGQGDRIVLLNHSMVTFTVPNYFIELGILPSHCLCINLQLYIFKLIGDSFLNLVQFK